MKITQILHGPDLEPEFMPRRKYGRLRKVVEMPSKGNCSRCRTGISVQSKVIKEMMYLRHVIGKGLNIHSSVAERKIESSSPISSLKFSSSSFLLNAWARL